MSIAQREEKGQVAMFALISAVMQSGVSLLAIVCYCFRTR